MRITDIKTYLARNPWKNWLFVYVGTEEGIHGSGGGTFEHLSRTVATAIQENKSPILGRDAIQIESMVTRWMRKIFADGVPWEKDLLTRRPKLVVGYLEMPTAQGLGADLNLEVVEGPRVTPGPLYHFGRTTGNSAAQRRLEEGQPCLGFLGRNSQC